MGRLLGLRGVFVFRRPGVLVSIPSLMGRLLGCGSIAPGGIPDS